MGAWTKDKAQELEDKLRAMRAGRSTGDASSMWTLTAKASRKQLERCYGSRKATLVVIERTGDRIERSKGKWKQKKRYI